MPLNLDQRIAPIRDIYYAYIMADVYVVMTPLPTDYLVTSIIVSCTNSELQEKLQDSRIFKRIKGISITEFMAIKFAQQLLEEIGAPIPAHQHITRLRHLRS